MTDAQIEAAIAELALKIMPTLADGHVFDAPSEMWEREQIAGGYADEAWTHYASCQIYGSSSGPSAGEILADDIGLPDDEREWVGELCDDLSDAVILPQDHPKCIAAFTFWDDNCLWASWLFDGYPEEE